MEEAKTASEHEDNEVEDIFSEINEKKITDEDVDNLHVLSSKFEKILTLKTIKK